MEKKLKILFYNADGAGVNYFRTLTPATEIERNHSDEIYVDITQSIDFNSPETINYLKNYDIIHYHRQLHPDIREMKKLSKELNDAGVVLIMDIDDYWNLHDKHPFYGFSIEKNIPQTIIQNLKIANYVTTTTDIFANEIRKVTGRDNVAVLYNSVNPEWMKQFQNNWKPDPDGRVRISYIAGSSHWVDVQQLIGVMNVLSNDIDLKDKFKIIIAGWDAEGTTTDISFNEEFAVEMQKRGLWTHDIVKAINKTRGNVDEIPKIPLDLKEKYRNNIFLYNNRDIHSTESIYSTYEKILTDNHKLITNQDYYQWLMNFERNVTYPNEGNFARRWTEKANTYARVLDETDIVIAPLSDNTFNRMKCVVGDTLINTNKGLLKIRDLVVKRYHDLEIMNNKVVSYFKYKDEKTIKIKTNIGIEIEGTPTHRILVDDEWKAIGKFTIGDKIQISPFTFESGEYQIITYPILLNGDSNRMVSSIIIDDESGRFWGYIIGNSRFSINHLTISLDTKYYDVIDDVVDLGEKMGLSPTTITSEPNENGETNTIKDEHCIDFTSIRMRNMCIEDNSEIPYFILKSPKSVIREFLRGLFELNSIISIENSSITLSNKNIGLIKQIQMLLLGFGIVTEIRTIRNRICGKNYYSLHLGNIASNIFYSEIGFISQIKREKLTLMVEKSNLGEYSEQSFECFVTEIVEGVGDVYDVEVENIHKYIGNGLTNHNSNLKQVECWTRKLPIVCSDIPPYNVHGRHMENCVLISLKPSEKHAHKEWKKYLKKLILDADLRKRLGDGLYNDFKDLYNLRNVTEKRVKFYENVLTEKQQIKNNKI